MADVIEVLAEALTSLSGLAEDLGVDLDFSLDSVSDLDGFFDEFDPAGAPLPEGRGPGSLHHILFALGVYLGEVIIRESGAAEWAPSADDVEDPWQAHLKGLTTDYSAYPISKVLRRYEEGAEHNLSDFATAAIGIFSGEIGIDGPPASRLS